ncbi:winged helix-turn-helix transcriptional regulator [Mycolicibacterium moriokaense]|uniref:winged helix-turn-helix transcriptional regulator n=1 Tax=Mycolicibacterium moriokaense TaxID=39691 RepID=UPI000D75334D
MDLAGHSRIHQRHNMSHGLLARALPKLARTILSARLHRLINLGVFQTVPVSRTSPYHEYRLTEMGRQPFPVVTALRQWGGEYLFDPSEPRRSHRRTCARLTGKWCGQKTPNSSCADQPARRLREISPIRCTVESHIYRAMSTPEPSAATNSPAWYVAAASRRFAPA